MWILIFFGLAIIFLVIMCLSVPKPSPKPPSLSGDCICPNYDSWPEETRDEYKYEIRRRVRRECGYNVTNVVFEDKPLKIEWIASNGKSGSICGPGSAPCTGMIHC